LIYKLATKYIAEHLADKHYPFEVTYGPEAFVREGRGNRVVIMRDTQSDSFGPPPSSARNGFPDPTRSNAMTGRLLGVRNIGVVAYVFGKATMPGATRAEHEDIVDCCVDAIQCALYNTGAQTRMPVAILGGRFVPKAELEGVHDKFAGVIYEMRFTMQRGVTDRTYEGDGLSVVTLDKVTTSLEVNGEETDTPIIAPASATLED
jgi:hypothetical protein